MYTQAYDFIETVKHADQSHIGWLFDDLIVAKIELKQLPVTYGNGILIIFYDDSFAIITDSGHSTTGELHNIAHLVPEVANHVKKCVH